MSFHGRPNLLTFLQRDLESPVPLSEFWNYWDWFTRPLLVAWQRYGGAQAVDKMPTLPPLWPHDLFFAHRLHCRKAYVIWEREARKLDSGMTLTAEQMIASWRNAMEQAARDSVARTFSSETLAATDGSSTASSWVQDMCQLWDPLSFPSDSAVYGNELVLAQALASIEENSSRLEQLRRQKTFENDELYHDIDRLHSTLKALELLPNNLNRQIESKNVRPT